MKYHFQIMASHSYWPLSEAVGRRSVFRSRLLVRGVASLGSRRCIRPNPSERHGAMIQRKEYSILDIPDVVWTFVKTVVGIIYTYIRHLIYGAKLGGPFAWPIVGNSIAIGRTGPAQAATFIKWINVYDPAYRVWIGELLHIILRDRRDTEVVLSGYKHNRKALIYKFLHPWLGQGLLTASGERWRVHRKIITPTFHFQILEQFVPVFSANSDIFVRKLGAHAGGPFFDIFPLLKLLTLDVVCESAMGVKVNAQLDSESEYVAAVSRFSDIFVERLSKPWLIPDFIFYRTNLGRRFKKVISTLHGTTEAVIRKRKQELDRMQGDGSPLTPDDLGRKKRVAFLDLLLLSQRAGADLSDTDIREEVDTFMFEGHDTTASGLMAIIYLLSKHEDVQKKIMEELSQLFDPSQPLELTAQSLGELKYVEMVVKEGLRLFPPVPVIARVFDSDQKLPSCGAMAPQSSTAFLHLYALHRDPAVFPDPEKFDPERFRPENCVGRDPFAYLPFSAGPRNCIGQRFAMMELKMVIAKMVWNFRIIEDPTYEPIFSFEITAQTANGGWIKLEKRWK